MRDPRTILITGASGGIGSALARAYAGPGAMLILHGRDATRLAAVEQVCAARGASVETQRLDLRDLDALRSWLEGVVSRHQVDLAVVNAGVSNAVQRGECAETWPDTCEIIDVNVRAALATSRALIPQMRRRGRGQIAFMSSLAAWYGLPVTPTYCASKAALKAYGEALRGLLAPDGIEVSVVLPGFVRTEMVARFPGPRPWLLSADDAAGRIQRGLQRNVARVAFPFPLSWGTWLLGAMPASLAQGVLRRLGFGR